MIISNPATIILTFFAGFLAILFVVFWIKRTSMIDARKVRSRLRDMTLDQPQEDIQGGYLGWFNDAVPKLGVWAESKPNKQTKTVRNQLLQAGYFQASAFHYYMGARFLSFLGFTIIGTALGYLLNANSPLHLIGGCIAGLCLGILAPSFWLSSQVAQRQRQLLMALPDALDMLVLCLDSGTSFQAALQRVSDELQAVHPILGIETRIVLREMQLGMSSGDSLMKFANRCALDDVRELALVIMQSEKFGASMSKALRNYAETARAQRQQRAEETAQKAAVKIIFPTMFCIFPAIFIVILGPVAYQTSNLFAK